MLAMRAVWLDAEDTAAVFSERLARLGHRDLTASVYVRRFAWSDWIDAEPGDRAAVAAWLADGRQRRPHIHRLAAARPEPETPPPSSPDGSFSHLVHPAVNRGRAHRQESGTALGTGRVAPQGRHRHRLACCSSKARRGPPTTKARSTCGSTKTDPGGIAYRKGELCARVRGTPAAGLLIIEALPPGNPDEDVDAAILAVVEDAPGIKAGEIRDAIKGDGKQVSKRLLLLIKSGDIIRKKGDGRATHHYIEDPTPHLSDSSD